jgi:hypothetical protein
MESSSLRSLCLILSVGALLMGGAGLVLSFAYLASASMADITAGTSGFIAGAVLIGSGLISLSMLASRPTSVRRTPEWDSLHEASSMQLTGQNK